MDELKKQGLFIELVTLQAATYGMVKTFICREKIPIKMEQLPVVMCIYDHGILCQQEIADAVCRDKSSVQRTVARLECQGLVEIHRNKDKRKKLLMLTKRGKEIAKKIAGFTPSSDQENLLRELNSKIAEKLRSIIAGVNLLQGIHPDYVLF